MPSLEEQFHTLEQILLHDPGNRGVAHLVCPGDLSSACHAMLLVDRAAIVTGFYIQSAGAHETDGPPGAVALGRALQAMGADVVYATDDLCVPLLKAVVASPVMTWSKENATAFADFDLLFSIERCGRAADGLYHNMRGMDISEWTAPWDEAFLNPKDDPFSIGVGDGGNEIGMGAVLESVVRNIPQGELIGCTVSTALLVTAGVSNWGAWGLVAGLSALTGRRLLPTEAEALSDLQAMVAAGAVDGVSGRREATVDGLSWEENAAMLRRLHEWCDAAMSS